MATTHHYRSHLTWQGSTGDGYRSYSRAHRVNTPPAEAELALSADPVFRGDADLHNPEQLLLAAASSCQLLAFLAEAALAGIDVLAYEDDAEAEMPVSAKPMRITSVTLRPRILVSPATDLGLVRDLVARAHEGCFIANTLNAEMLIVASVEHADVTFSTR